jgi:hypothetical protein
MFEQIAEQLSQQPVVPPPFGLQTEWDEGEHLTLDDVVDCYQDGLTYFNVWRASGEWHYLSWAITAYLAALRQLREMPALVQATAEWHTWFEVAQCELVVAKADLDQVQREMELDNANVD